MGFWCGLQLEHHFWHISTVLQMIPQKWLIGMILTSLLVLTCWMFYLKLRGVDFSDVRAVFEARFEVPHK